MAEQEKKSRIYLCIDLKSFYASVECAERGLDPMTTKLVVAAPTRSDKTICLAVSPSLKKLGVKNRCRVFEIPKNIKYIIAPPRMMKYIEYSAAIYAIYLRYISPDDIQVYSIDESFLDITDYLEKYKLTPKQMAVMLMGKITDELGIRATCGIGTNLYLTKIALDITAKHAPDFIGYLDEEKYRETLWDHTPLTDFWRIGGGTERRLAEHGIFTMGDIANSDEELIYKLFGIDGELLIDHAWGREPVTIKDIKAYRPKTNCLSSGQVLMRDYEFFEAQIVLKEMADSLCLDMTAKNVITRSVTIYVGYSNALHEAGAKGTVSFETETNDSGIIVPAVAELYEKVVSRDKPVRRLNITVNNIVEDDGFKALTLFDAETSEREKKAKNLQQAVVDIKNKYGKNAVFKGMSLQESATQRERNTQIGGHRSGEQ